MADHRPGTSSQGVLITSPCHRRYKRRQNLDAKSKNVKSDTFMSLF